MRDICLIYDIFAAFALKFSQLHKNLWLSGWGPYRTESAMTDSIAQFEKRLAQLERRHRELADGYVRKINPDGLITVEPSRYGPVHQFRVLVGFLCGFLLLKSAMQVVLGPVAYDERVLSMAGGTAFERMGAWIMQSDPLSRMMSDYLFGMF